jgi:hypothetical protein
MPPITPPAIAPTSGPEFVAFVDELIVDGTAEEGTHCIFWHSWQVWTVCEQTVPVGQVGQIPTDVSGQTTQRLKRDSKTPVGSISKVRNTTRGVHYELGL